MCLPLPWPINWILLNLLPYYYKIRWKGLWSLFGVHRLPVCVGIGAGLRRIGASEGHSYGVSMRGGRCQSRDRNLLWILSKTRQGARPGQVPQWAIEDNVRWEILARASVVEWNIDSTRETHRHRAPESVHHGWHHLSTPQRRQYQQNVKFVRTRAGRGQAGSKRQHQRAKDTLCHDEAHRQGKRVYRVDIDFRNAFNAMSQATLWHVMNMFHIPDVDLLEQTYDSATVRLAPNDAESATITFDTGVAQGNITSLQLFNIYINALLRMLTATGQNQGISNGLQGAGVPNMVWHGDQHKKNFLARNWQRSKAKESIPAPDLRINGERLKTLDINDACRYLGYWGTGNADLRATREVVREKARVARHLIKSHPLVPELSAEVFAQKGIGAFQFLATLIEWWQNELEGLQKIWVQAYKNAWHEPWSSINSLHTFPTAEGGHVCPLPAGVLTQALLQHVD